MYVPAHFEASTEQLGRLLSAPGLVELVTPGPDGLVATPLPMLHLPAGPGTLQGHVARNNPHWRAAGAATGESLAIVRGPDAYISPSWYPSKAEHGRVVPTWNYLTVHLYGRLVVHESTDWLRDLLTRLTAVHEAGVGSCWQPSDAPSAYLEGQLHAIVGLELLISRVEAKAKLGQNRSVADQASVVAALSGLPAPDQLPGPAGVATLMREQLEG
ncbi:MAG: FMN-binding negative transcriptional regulator [Jatrophihabitantaceae bacterium]